MRVTRGEKIDEIGMCDACAQTRRLVWRDWGVEYIHDPYFTGKGAREKVEVIRDYCEPCRARLKGGE